MAQIFHPSTNTISKVSIFGVLLLIGAIALFGGQILRSPYVTEVNVTHEQPVPFSHKHHVADAGIDCRYCHTSVENSAFAGIPATKICMSCHSMIWTTSPMLEPVRQSFATDKSLAWTRVHDLPDYVYFNHSIHIAKGVDCSTCHGPVNEMPLTWRNESLQMRWCLDCHQTMQAKFKLNRLTDCYTCHR